MENDFHKCLSSKTHFFPERMEELPVAWQMGVYKVQVHPQFLKDSLQRPFSGCEKLCYGSKKIVHPQFLVSIQVPGYLWHMTGWRFATNLVMT